MQRSGTHSQTASPIVGDWGSTRLRLWQTNGVSQEPAFEGAGMLAAQPECATVLADALVELGVDRSAEIWLCGMAGARGGLVETPYLTIPTSSADWVGKFVSIEIADYCVKVAPGVCSPPTGTPDVMRGEEAQVFGALAVAPQLLDGESMFLCPGTHSKWVTTRDGSITYFSTIPTGEIFARMLGSSLAPAGKDEDDEGYAHGLERAADGLPALFEARAAQLLRGKGASWSRGYLSGVLIGMEIRSMLDQLDKSQELTVIGESSLSQLYLSALEKFGVSARCLPDDRCTLAGLEIALDA